MKIRLMHSRLVRRVRSAAQRAREASNSAGMATAEYAVGVVAACGFAGLLVTILKSPEVRGLLFGIIKKAISA